jgi:dihydrolipoamide dehydrogenase
MDDSRSDPATTPVSPSSTRRSQPDDGTRSGDTHFDVAVIGAGSAGETLTVELASNGRRVVVFEPELIGGECPYVACMPTKAMLHDAAIGRSWADSIRRRGEVVDHLDDSRHAGELERSGATLVRHRARLRSDGSIRAGGQRYDADGIVIATGSTISIPPVDGLADLGDRCWTSVDAMTADERPTRLAIVGGGVIGCELATIFARFGTEVHLLDVAPTAFPDLPPEIGDIVDDTLAVDGVRVRRGVSIDRVARRGGGVRTTFDTGACLDTDRLLIATGTQPRTTDLGLEELGVDPENLQVDHTGRVAGASSLWAIGDVAGFGEYTHLANRQAKVVAAALLGGAPQRFDDGVTPACVFTDPPIVTIGPRPADLSSDDVCWVSARMNEIARWTTDELGEGFLTIAVDRATHRVVAAHGIGTRFDELAAALVTAIDGGVSVDRLARSMWPFPSVGELLGVVYSRAAAELAS